jgi:type I restriction enzyme, S subunit
MNKESKIVPKLRFPEFLSEGEWVEKKLGLLAKKIVEKNKDGSINNVFTNSAIDGIVDQREYFDKDIADINNLENYYIVEDGDYVYNPRISNIAPVGPISKNKTKKTGAMSPLYTVFRFYDKNNGFYEYYFKSAHWYASIRKASNTGARFDRMSVTDSVFMDIPILYPHPKEQQKIASCLSSLDKLMATETQKLDTLKTHKKGLMQQLFPSEGETMPKLRFKEFENSGEWKEKRFEELFEIGNGRDYKHLDKGVIPVYGSGGYMLSVNDYLYDGDSVCIGRKGTIDKPMFLTGKFWTVDTLFYTHSFKGCLPKYIHYIFQNIDWRKHNEAGGVPSLSKTNIYKIETFVPSLKEQQKIASCLSSLDEQIAAQAQKIEVLKAHKKGLMQGLFPSITN